MAKQYMFDFGHFFCNHPVYGNRHINPKCYINKLSDTVKEYLKQNANWINIKSKLPEMCTVA
jgi:hypothetical protein